jgi:hypothetical protein
MKKSILIVMFSILLFGCKSQSVTNTNVDNKTERIIKGDWTVTNVSFPGSDYIKVTSFDLVDSKCLVGSTWKFVSNNNNGTMTLNDASCISFSSPITWYINQDGNFVMKIINDYKAKKVNQGYILRVANVTETSFELVDKINVGGSMKEVTYQFQKNN